MLEPVECHQQTHLEAAGWVEQRSTWKILGNVDTRSVVRESAQNLRTGGPRVIGPIRI